VQASLLGLLFEAYFQNGLDVANNEVLVSLAVRSGMDGARAKQVLQTGEGRDEVIAELKATRARGVKSVPTLTFPDGESISGAHDVPSLVSLLRRQIASVSRASG
jgi:predicted DsbA family dithiol-disulfide isomerase